MKAIKVTLLAVSALLVFSCEKQNTTEKVEDNATEVAALDNVEKKVASVDGAEKATPVTDETTVSSENAPILFLESETYDFGDVQANSTTERIVEFTNNGKSPLVIKTAKASCGCTVPDWDKEPVAPGESGTMKVSYKAPATNGKQTKTVTLTTNTESGTERFKITANVVGGKEKQIKQSPTPPPAPAKQQLPAPKLESVN